MSKFLDQFLLTMPDTQRQKLMEILELKQKAGILRSQQEMQAELERLLKEIGRRNGKPTFQARKQDGKTDSKSYNSNMDEIAFDLSALFEASNQIDRLLNDNQQLSRSLLSDIRKKIQTLGSKMQRYLLILKNTSGFVDGVYEHFRIPQYTEADERMLMNMRKDRYGKALPLEYQAEIRANSLQLAGVQTQDQLKTNYGRKLASIQVRNRIGVEASHPQHKIDYAIDGSQESFWAEAVMADEPIIQDISDIWTHDYAGEEYPSSGALCELEIALNGITTVSEIHFDPYGAYPLEVVAIHGYETADLGGKQYRLVSPQHSNPYQRSQKSVGLMTFQFPSVDISKIRILIRQENYTRENFLVAYDDLQNQELWNQLSADRLIPDQRDPNETIASFDKRNQITGWTSYLNALKEWAEKIGEQGILESAKKAMEVIRTGDYKNPMLLALQAIQPKEETQPVSAELQKTWQAMKKIMYVYGAYNISVFGRRYQQESIYISKPLPLPGNTSQVSLEVEEGHQSIALPDGDQIPITDIEYYVTHKKEPLIEDWFPILPIGKTYIECERLLGSDVAPSNEFPADSIVFRFRFPAVSRDTIVVRRNGTIMPKHTYMINDEQTRLAIPRSYYSASAIYTISYAPVDTAYLVKFGEKEGLVPTQYIGENGETGEYFSQANQDGSIQLKHKPFLYRDTLFQYNRFTEKHEQDATQFDAADLYFPIIVRVNKEEWRNITDYSSNSYDPKRLTENDGKCYAHIGNRIWFGQPVNGAPIEKITVDYYYVTTNIRLKAILRRNHASYESVTPVLHAYTLKCQTYDMEA